jgi:hypothetical protein
MCGYVQLLDEGVVELEANPLTNFADPFSRKAPPAVVLATPVGAAVRGTQRALGLGERPRQEALQAALSAAI